jgi:hypothetical protein
MALQPHTVECIFATVLAMALIIAATAWAFPLYSISGAVVGHGVSLLCWRSGGLEHPHDTPPYPFTPSPTFAHSSPPLELDHCGGFGLAFGDCGLHCRADFFVDG